MTTKATKHDVCKENENEKEIKIKKNLQYMKTIFKQELFKAGQKQHPT